jgi:S-DNA-T family DNA segregation ATPase FtsK/SpoIIIE
VLVVAASGLGDLAGGAPKVSASWRTLEGAGGVVGATLATPTKSFLGLVGAVVLFAAIAFPALCTVLGGSVGAVIRGLRRGVFGTASWLAATVTEARQASAGRVVEASDRSPLATDAARPEPARLLAPGMPVIDDASGLEEAPAELAGKGDEGASPAPAPADPAGKGHGAVLAGRGAASADPGRAEQLSLGIAPATGPWRLPAPRLLERSTAHDLDEREIDAAGHVLERALSAHGVETKLVGFTVGPTVTRYELELGAGVKVARVTSLSKDIAYAMASADVRILAPIPGRSAIGVEVPNRQRQLVTLGDVLASPEARRMTHPLEVPIGRDIAGRAVVVNLAEMPHILIAGATGAGKSSCINSIVTSILMRSTPDQVRLILVDPKRVELGQYNGLPHLLAQVVVNPKRAANALSWAVAEMERRYDLLAEVGMRDISGYNAAFDRGEFAPDARLTPYSAARPIAAGAAVLGPPAPAAPLLALPAVVTESADEPDEPDAPGEADALGPVAGVDEVTEIDDEDESGTLSDPGRAEPSRDRLPHVLIVVDELNDLMMVAARDVEDSICRLAQMARAVGIHLVVATQRPSVDVITGVIKANIPSRLAFSVSSLADSRVILDQPGAERLVGRGDLLLLTASSSVARRIQGPWVTEKEVHAVVASWRRQSGPRYVEGVEGDDASGRAGTGGVEDDDDELLRRAMELVVRSQLGSTSMLQRKLRVGFARAGRLMDLLERRGVVGPSEGSKARAVLMTADELDQLGQA